MTYKGIFFDLYGTLLLYGDVRAAWADWLEVFHRSLLNFGLTISKNEFSQKCDGFFEKSEPPIQNDGLTIYERRIRNLCNDLKLDLKVKDIQSTANNCADAWHAHISLDPETPDILRKLKSRYTLALISNFDHPPYIHNILKRYGLGRLFEIIVISGEIGIKKPDPRIFEVALDKTGLQSHEAAYIGDAEVDIQGAQSAGMYPVRIRREGLDHDSLVLDFNTNYHRGQTGPAPIPVKGVSIISHLSELTSMFL